MTCQRLSQSIVKRNVNGDAYSGRPSTSTTDENIGAVKKIILTIRSVAVDVGLSFGSWQRIFTNILAMKHATAKIVPKFWAKTTYHEHHSDDPDPDFLKKVITGHELWMYGYDLETRAQSSQCKLPEGPRPKETCQIRANVKTLVSAFFNCNGVGHHEFVPQGRTVNKDYYLEVMRQLREAFRQKCTGLLKNQSSFLHHDNAPAQTSMLVHIYFFFRTSSASHKPILTH